MHETNAVAQQIRDCTRLHRLIIYRLLDENQDLVTEVRYDHERGVWLKDFKPTTEAQCLRYLAHWLGAGLTVFKVHCCGDLCRTPEMEWLQMAVEDLSSTFCKRCAAHHVEAIVAEIPDDELMIV